MIFPEIYLILMASLPPVRCNHSAKKGCLTNEVMHPINDLPTNWYGEHFGYHPNLERYGFNAGPIPCLSTREDPPLKHILVNEVKDIAHRKETTDLIVSKLDRSFLQNLSILDQDISKFVQFFTIIVAISVKNDN